MTLKKLNNYSCVNKEVEYLSEKIKNQAMPDDMLKMAHQRAVLEYNELMNYIIHIPDSQTRQIFMLRFIDGLTWSCIADIIGGHNTEDSVKKRCYRYFKERNRRDNS